MSDVERAGLEHPRGPRPGLRRPPTCHGVEKGSGGLAPHRVVLRLTFCAGLGFPARTEKVL